MVSKRLVPLVIIAFLSLTFCASIFQIEPAKATTLNYQVSQGTDDCFKAWVTSSWEFHVDKLDNEGGYWNSGDYKEGGGMRFQNITIPQGSTIISAYLQFWVGTYGLDFTNPYCHNKIRGEDADTSSPFSTVGDFDGRTRTTAVVDWTYIEPWYQNNWYSSPDVSTIVQEIVDRAGWASGNNMTLFRDDFDDRSAHIDYTSRICSAYERGGVATAPKLIITYDSGSGDSGSYLYQLHGPYRENGDVYDGIVNITLSFASATPQYYMVNGSDGVADNLDIYTNETATSMFWNISSDHTWQRTYRFSNTTQNYEVYIYVPDSTLDVQITQYQIGVTDFAGLTNAYIETTKNVAGYIRTIERRSLDVLNNMPVWLIPFTQYNLRVISSEGTWTFDLLADAVTTKQYVITKDMITQMFTGTNITVSATRLNATAIAIVYSDPLLLTTSISSTIVHRNSSSSTGYTTDFSQVDSTYVTSITWNEGAGNLGYIANVTVLRDGEYLTWTFSLPVPSTDVVQFFLGYFDLFGVFPIPTYQLPAIFLCLLFFGIGSWRDSDILSGITIVIAGLLTIIGWGSFPAAGIATSIMVVVFMYLHKGKQDTVIFE